MGENLVYATRGAFGFSLKRGVVAPETLVEKDLNPKDAICRTFKFSNNGDYFCYVDSERTVLVEVSTGKELIAENLGKTSHILFSPRDKFMVTFEPYVIYGISSKNEDGTQKKPNPNLRFWSIPERKHLHTSISSKQSDWMPKWSEDEEIMIRLVGSEIMRHDKHDFTKYSKKTAITNIRNFEVSPGQETIIACFVPPVKGQPANVQLRRCDDYFSLIRQKIFMRCDKVDMYWNSKGNALAVISSLEVDETNRSYYGESQVHIMTVNCEGFMVHRDKEGPVHTFTWNPNGTIFALCYGFMPAKVTLYNLRGDTVWALGEGSRNEIYFNRFGNVFLTCGFGNLSAGRMQFWDVEEKKEIIGIEVPNTTYFSWAPDGQHFVTATTAPRLRIDNGYRIWHYTGKMLFEYSAEKYELWEFAWRPLPAGAYNKFAIPKLTKEQKSQAGLLVKIKNNNNHPIQALPAGAITKASAYVPPHLRKGDSNKGALAPVGATPQARLLLSETEKKIKTIHKKLDDIKKLKEKQANGEKLEVNQLSKIDKESELISELANLEFK